MEYEDRKGSVVFKEEVFNRKLVLPLAIAGYGLTFLYFYFTFTYLLGSFSEYALEMTAGTLVFIPVTLPVLYRLKYPLIIYENGFDEPTSILKFNKDQRFIPFQKVKNIYPKYGKPQGPTEMTGLTIILSDGKKVEIQEFRDKKLNKIIDSFREAIGKGWEHFYVDRPFLGYEELKEIKEQLAKSKALVYAKGIAAIGIPFSVLIFALFSSVDQLTIIILYGAVMVSVFVGINIVMKYKKAKTRYEQLVKKSPDKKKDIFGSIDVDVEKDASEKIDNYTHKDWKELEEMINTKKYLYIIGLGAGITTGSLILNVLFDNELIVGIAMIGVAVLHAPIYFGRKQYKKKKLVKDLVEKELKEDKKILPDWFEIKSRWNLPMREAPEFSRSKWKKLVKSSHVIKPTRMALFMSGAMVGIAFFLIGLLMIELNIFLLLALLLTFWALYFGHFILEMYRKNVLDSVLDYEEMSGEKVIPEEHREKIYTGWTDDESLK